VSPHRRAVATRPADIPTLQDAIHHQPRRRIEAPGYGYLYEVAPNREKVWEGHVEVFSLTTSSENVDALDSIEGIAMAGR